MTFGENITTYGNVAKLPFWYLVNLSELAFTLPAIIRKPMLRLLNIIEAMFGDDLYTLLLKKANNYSLNNFFQILKEDILPTS